MSLREYKHPTHGVGAYMTSIMISHVKRYNAVLNRKQLGVYTKRLCNLLSVQQVSSRRATQHTVTILSELSD